jgi:hypothetical protein
MPAIKMGNRVAFPAIPCLGALPVDAADIDRPAPACHPGEGAQGWVPNPTWMLGVALLVRFAMRILVGNSKLPFLLDPGKDGSDGGGRWWRRQQLGGSAAATAVAAVAAAWQWRSGGGSSSLAAEAWWRKLGGGSQPLPPPRCRTAALRGSLEAAEVAAGSCGSLVQHCRAADKGQQ